MPIANASECRLGVIAETAWGTTPATPAFNVLRYTGESFAYETETAQSNEIRPDRNVTDNIRLGQQAGGGFDFELSYGQLDTILESLFYNTWATNVLTNGATQKSMTFEKTFEMGATDNFFRYVGCIADTMSLSIAARSIITGSLGFVGKGGTTGTAIIAGATYVNPTTKDVMSASVDFAGLSMSGMSPTPSIKSVELNFANNLRGQPVVGSNELVGVGAGRFMVTGRISAYFDDMDLYNAYLLGTASSLAMTLGSVTAEKYTISLPKIKFTNGAVQAGSADSDVMADMDFIALFDSGISGTARITRAVA